MNEQPNHEHDHEGDNLIGSAMGVARSVIATTGGVLEEVVHAGGRLGTTVVHEVLTVVGSVTAGLGDIFHGRTTPRDENTPDSN